MRMALFMCGEPRTMEYCYPSHKEFLLDRYDPDVYVATDESQVERIQELYKPVNLYSASQADIMAGWAFQRMVVAAPADDPIKVPAASIYYKIWFCSQARQALERMHGFKYDVVVLSRFDLKIASLQPITVPEPSTIYVPRLDAYFAPWDLTSATPGIHWGGYSEHITWMAPDVFDRVYSRYFDPADYWTLAAQADGNVGKNPEFMLKYFCDKNGIQSKMFEAEMMLIRGTPEKPLAYDHTPLSEHPPF